MRYGSIRLFLTLFPSINCNIVSAAFSPSSRNGWKMVLNGVASMSVSNWPS